jgi:hypothetical protein
MGFSLKSTSFEPKTSEQIKNRHMSKLHHEQLTKLNRNGQTQFFLQSLMVIGQAFKRFTLK